MSWLAQDHTDRHVPQDEVAKRLAFPQAPGAEHPDGRADQIDQERKRGILIANHKNSIPKYVVTSTPLQAQWNNTTIMGHNVVEAIAELKQQPGKTILVEGSATLVEALAQAGLIDEYILLVHPVIVGNGKRFFRDGMGLSKLKLVESKPISLGVVACTTNQRARALVKNPQ